MVTNNSCDYQPVQYNVQTGGANGTLNNVAPSATSGVPVISQGSSAQPVFGTTVVAGGGTGITSATAYALLAGGTTSTGVLQSLSTGTTGQVLQSGGSGGLATWIASSSSGSLVKLQTQTASNSASINFTSQISATYTTYFVVYDAVIPITNAVDLQLVISANNGSSYVATLYKSSNLRFESGTAISTSTTCHLLATSIANTASYGTAGSFYLYNTNNSVNSSISGVGFGSDSVSWNSYIVGGNNPTTSVNAFKILFSSGNISSGTFTLYGVVQ